MVQIVDYVYSKLYETEKEVSFRERLVIVFFTILIYSLTLASIFFWIY
jgi:hypothetical protein